MITATARRYAKATIEAAAEEKAEDRFLEQLEIFATLLREHEELARVLSNPAFPFSSKESIAARLSERLGFHPLVRNTLLVMLRNGRMGIFDQVVEAVRRLRDDQLGIVRAEVHSVRPLPDALKKRLAKVVSEMVGSDVRCTWNRDESLIGGLKIQIESLVLDGSIRARLEAVRKTAAG